MDPQDLKALFRRWSLPVVAMVVIGAAAAYAVSRALTPVYRAQGSLLVVASNRPLGSNSPLDTQASQIVATDAALITQAPLLDRVSTELNLGLTATELEKSVTVTPRTNTQILDVAIADNDPQRAAQIANTLMADFVAQVTASNQKQIDQASAGLADLIKQTQDRLRSENVALASAQTLTGAAKSEQVAAINGQIAADTSTLGQLTANYTTLRANAAQNVDSVQQVSAAAVPTKPAFPNKVLNAILGGLAGGLVGIALAAHLEYLDQGLRNEQDVRRKLGLPTLGVVPRFSGRGKGNNRNRELAAEAYRRLRTNLLFSSVDTQFRSVLITSTRSGEGKSRTAANLASVLAMGGSRVVLVDADMRRPTQHRVFRRPLEYGMTDMLLSMARSEGLSLNGHHATSMPGLSLITAGTIPPNPAELLISAHTKTLLHAIESNCDLMVIDSPPVDAVSDALSLAPTVSATVLVIEAGHINAMQAARAIAALRGVGANVVGVVLNKARQRDIRGYYRYYYSYQHTPSQGAKPRKASPPREPVGSWEPVTEPASRSVK
jgi:capsular exopolysaccharide synthesis family protein